MDINEAKLLDHQAELTQQLRRHLYRLIGLPRLKKIIDVGCGSGLISAEMAKRGVSVTGVDADPAAISIAKKKYPDTEFQHVSKDALPFADESFDLAFCHFVLMWQKEPAKLLQQMARVVRKGGWVVAAAEPDYGGRIAHPDDALTKPLAKALRAQSADPYCGKKLREIFINAGMKCNVGIWPSVVESPCRDENFQAEWDLYNYILKESQESALIEKSKIVAKQADKKGTRLLFMPIFFAYGQKGPASRRRQ